MAGVHNTRLMGTITRLIARVERVAAVAVIRAIAFKATASINPQVDHLLILEKELQ